MAIVQHLVVDEFGAHIGKYSERLKVTKQGATLAQAPLLHLESVTVANQGVSVSAEAIRECTERGIPIHFISGTGTAYASLYSAGLTGTVATRRAQLEAFHMVKGLYLVLALGMGKLQNQANLIKYLGKYRKETNPALYDELRCLTAEVLDHLIEMEQIKRYPEIQDGSASVGDFREELMGLEGRAAQRYWKAVRLVLPESLGFPGRTGRRATDPINAALNYGYGILYGQCERCLVLAGLDPYGGFLHVDRPGKPSLTLDFIEEWRQAVVDRTVIAMANKGAKFDAEGEIKEGEMYLLAKDVRRTLAEKVQERLDGHVGYEGKQHTLRSVMQMQARRLATWLRNERPSYEPFEMGW